MAKERIKLTDAESKFLASHMRGEKKSVPKKQKLAIGYSKIRTKRKKKGEKKR